MQTQFAGIDAGGSWSRVLARTDRGGDEIRIRKAGANLRRHGLQWTADTLTSLLLQVLERRRLPISAMVAGVAGAGERQVQETLENRIRSQLGPDAPPILAVVHDGVIALETSFPEASGMLAIAGTGSAVLARTVQGRLARAGGWGYLAGDEGSGYAIGRRGIRAIASAYDGGAGTSLVARLAAHRGIGNRKSLLTAIYDKQWPLQDLAPMVLQASEDGDTVARTIVREEVAALARQVFWLQQRESGVLPRICVSGGMMQSTHYFAQLKAALHAILPEAHVEKQSQPSVAGAASLARKLARGTLSLESLRITDSGGDL